MKEETEIKIAKVIALIIVLITIFLCKVSYANAIEELFKKYNPKQAHYIMQIVRDVAKEKQVDARIIASIIVHESGVKPHAISKGGDYGLMQVRWHIHRKTYPQLKNARMLLEVKTNVQIGTDIFARYYAQKKTLRGALMRYNGGSKRLADKVIRTAKLLGGNNGR